MSDTKHDALWVLQENLKRCNSLIKTGHADSNRALEKASKIEISTDAFESAIKLLQNAGLSNATNSPLWQLESMLKSKRDHIAKLYDISKNCLSGLPDLIKEANQYEEAADILAQRVPHD